jgi:ABC-type molybdate transport system substrate-binding protein
MAGTFQKAGLTSSSLIAQALAAQKENPDQQIVTLPDNLAVGADYGLTVLNGVSTAAQRLADFIVSPEGQKILAKHGFAPGSD